MGDEEIVDENQVGGEEPEPEPRLGEVQMLAGKYIVKNGMNPVAKVFVIDDPMGTGSTEHWVYAPELFPSVSVGEASVKTLTFQCADRNPPAETAARTFYIQMKDFGWKYVIAKCAPYVEDMGEDPEP